MSSSGLSKVSRGGKEDQKDDRTSGTAEGSISEQTIYEVNDLRGRVNRLEDKMDEQKRSIDDKLDALMAMVSKLGGSQPTEWKTPKGESPQAEEPESIKLSVHFDEEDTPIKKEEAHEEPRRKKQDRLSSSFKNAVDMQSIIDSNSGSIEYMKRAPDISGLRLGSLSEREIVDWYNRWDEIMAEHPRYPFNFALSISPYIKQKMVTMNEIPDGLREVNRAGFPELIRWLCVCIRPVDKVEFIRALENNVFFRSKRDFVLTEKNHRDFYENIKMYNRDFCCLLDILMDSLQEGQEAPPMTVKEGVGILFVYIKKYPVTMVGLCGQTCQQKKNTKLFRNS